ncbi:MAG: Clp protease N-terminal domain-containing protein [Candidatus Dormibacteria bacterium]
MHPFERFTQASKRVLTLAQDEAEKSHHSYIGTEHVLLGLLRESDGLAAKVLGSLGVEIEHVRATIESVLGRNERIIAQQIIPTSRVKKVFEFAFAEAKREGDHHVGTEHLLLGLLIEGEGIAAHVLEDLGATMDRVREQIASLKAHDLRLAPPQPGQAEEDPWRLLRRLHDQLHTSSPPRVGQIPRPAPHPEGPFAAASRHGRVGAAARSALALAEEETVRLGERQIGTDHLLLGLLRQREGGAARVLEQLDVDLNRVRAAASAVERPLPAAAGAGPVQMGSELLGAVRAAQESADSEGRWCETGDLLVAISRPGSGRATEILAHLGVVHLKLKEQVMLVLGDEPAG